MNLYPKNKKTIIEVKKFVIVFYIVGFIGFVVPYSKEFFISITPFALLINAYLLAIYHTKYDLKTIAIFSIVYLAGFFVELVGVNTGLIFGYYTYGNAMGLKIFGTPLLIGVNWLFLTYSTISISKQLKINNILIVFFAPFLMIIYDLVIEQLACKMDMWCWQNNKVPLQNYIAWYFIAVLFALLFKLLKIETKNNLAGFLFISQFVFFSFLLISDKIGN